MNLIKLKVGLVVFAMFISSTILFAADLEIEGGKNLLFGFVNHRGSKTIVDQGTTSEDVFINTRTWPSWYDANTVYDNVNIGAATKVILDSAWEYVYVSSKTEITETKRQDEEIYDELVETAYKYADVERLATLSIKNDGQLVLNNGSELQIRNQYSLITSAGDVDVMYKKEGDDAIVIDKTAISTNKALEYDTKDKDGVITAKTIDMKMTNDPVTVFTGKIVFGQGARDTILTFKDISKDQISKGVGAKVPTATYEWDGGATASGGKKTYKDIIETEAVKSSNQQSWTVMRNNFEINSNRAVFDVQGEKKSVWMEQDFMVQLEMSHLSGDGMIVKKGNGALSIGKVESFYDGVESYLTGNNTGYGWCIEEGMVLTNSKNEGQDSYLGKAAVYIDEQGTLGITASFVEDEQVVTKTSNDITINGGGISIDCNTMASLLGNLTGGEKKSAQLLFGFNSELSLHGDNSGIDDYLISYGIPEKDGQGYNNYLYSDVEGLATKNIIAKNDTSSEYKDTAFFELVLDEDENKEYSGNLQGEMFFRKQGSGLVTLSGENTYTEGTYISEGGLLLATSDSIGEGKIIFDGGVNGDSTTYSTIGVSSATEIVEIDNDIHIKNGAIFNVYENQTFGLSGSIESINPGVNTEIVKVGSGTAIILKSEKSLRQSNISKYTIEEGDFILDDGIVLNSEFYLNGKGASLTMREGAGIKDNEINIKNGNLIIFNEANISSATAVNFSNVETSTENFSKLHISSVATITKPNLINIAKNIEFVIDATTTANMNSFNFASGADTTIVKSGDGLFVANGQSNNFALENLYINGGILRFDSTPSMTVSSKTIVDGGFLIISSSSHFASTASSADDKQIVVLNGGIGIYDDNSIDSNTLLSFEGTDEQNLSKLIVEAADVNLTNSIYVKTGVIIENENDLTFSGESITYDPSSTGLLAKSGKGTMTINPLEEFEMGEVRVLEGDLVVESNISVSTVAISGKKAIMTIEDGTSSISSLLSIKNEGLLNIETATLNAKVIDLISSTMTLVNNDSYVNSQVINATDGSLISGYGTIDSVVNLQKDSAMIIGKDDEFSELDVADVNFETGSSLCVDITSDLLAAQTSDKLNVNNITVQEGVNLFVNMLGDEAGYDTGLSFEIINYAGEAVFEQSANEIFDINLSNTRFSASTSLINKSIFLNIVQEFSLYELPGATKNQATIIKVLNDIYDNPVSREKFKNTLKTMDVIYSDYLNTGSPVEFISALQDLSGIFYANSFMTSAMFSKSNIIYNRLRDYNVDRELDSNVWAQVYTSNFNVAASEENPKFENNMCGIIAGYDTVYDDETTVGFAGFYGQGELKQLEDKADVIDAGANIYANYKATENIAVKGLLGYSVQNYDTTRKLNFIKEEIKSKYATNTVSFDLEGSYRCDLSRAISLKPIVGANCAIVSNGDIEEDGDLEQKLKIKENTYTRAEAKVGVGLESRSISAFNWHLSAFAKQILVGEQFKAKVSSAYLQDYEFEIESTKLPVTSFAGTIGCSYDLNSAVRLSLDLNADTGSASMFGGNIGATYRW